MRYVNAIVVVLVAFSGCADETARQEAAARGEFLNALAQVGEANRGYVDDQPEGSPPQPLSEYRQEKLDEARPQLEAVIKNGSAAQRQAARELAADIDVSRARFIFCKALVARMDLADRSALILDDLIAVDLTNDMAESLNTDNSEQVKRLETSKVATRRLIGGLETQRQELDPRIAALKGEISKLNDQADAAGAEARRFRDDAFLQEGAAHYDLLDQATAAARHGAVARSAAHKSAVTLDVYASEHRMLSGQIDSAEGLLASIGEQITQAGTRQENARDALQKAEARRDAAIARMDAAIKQIATDFDVAVEAKFAEAQQQMNSALELLDQVASQDRSSPTFDAKGLDFQRLATLMTKLHMLTAQILAQGNLGATLNVIVARTGTGQHPFSPAKHEALQRSVQKLAADQAAVIAELVKVGAEAGTIAEKLANSPDELVADVAARHLGQLQTIPVALRAATLNPDAAQPEPPQEATPDSNE